MNSLKRIVAITGILMTIFALVSRGAESTLPCWQTPAIVDDPILFVKSASDLTAKATLLRVPKADPVIKNSSGNITYELMHDYTWTAGSRFIYLTPDSRIPHTTDSELHPKIGSASSAPVAIAADNKSWLLFAREPGHLFRDLQCAASYLADDDWTPPKVPSAADSQLRHLRAKLHAKLPIVIVVLGDSISTGLNATSTANLPPYQLGYIGLVAEKLHNRFSSQVSVVNLSVSGKSSPWALKQLDTVIASKPDLFICAFGMNDASEKRPADIFSSNINEVVNKVTTAYPTCDTIIVSPMTANPEWKHAAPKLYPEYATNLEKLANDNIAVANVTRIWELLIKRKSVLDFTGNGLNHPNDFGHRIYADVILETVGY